MQIDDCVIELADCTETLLREIALPECKRADVASTYGLAILSSEPKDWPRVNEAIIARWSKSGLEWIKKRAWKLIEEKRQAHLPPDKPPD